MLYSRLLKSNITVNKLYSDNFTVKAGKITQNILRGESETSLCALLIYTWIFIALTHPYVCKELRKKCFGKNK